MNHSIARSAFFAIAVSAVCTAALIGSADAQDPSAPAAPVARILTLDLAKRGGGFVDNPPPYSAKRAFDSPGDTALLAGPVAAADGSPAGTVSAVITTVQATRRSSREQLSGTFVLPDGQITVQGVVLSSDRTDVVAITGGTGVYRGASGDVVSTSTEQAITFTLNIVR